MAAPARTVSPGIRWARIVPVPMRAAEEKKLGDCKHNLRVFCFIYPYAGFDAISTAEISAGVDIDDCCRISAADFMQIPQGAANREGRAAGRPPKAGQWAKPAETVRRTVWPSAESASLRKIFVGQGQKFPNITHGAGRTMRVENLLRGGARCEPTCRGPKQ